MDIGAKGKVLVAKSDRAIVQIGRKKVTVGVRSDVKVKRGDIVVVTLGNIVAKM